MNEPLRQYLTNDEKLNGALIGIDVRLASTGESVFAYNNDIRLRPASNMKLFTAVTALQVVGEDYRFETEIGMDGNINGNVLEGNLFLIGRGDSTLGTEQFDEFAETIKAKGIEQINGAIIGDDTWYDAIRLSSDLVWTDEQYYYGSEVSALTVSPNQDFDTGSVIIEVEPGKIGRQPSVTIFPNTNYIAIRNDAETVKKADEDELIIEREHGGNCITVRGNISHNSKPIKEMMAVWGASEYAMELFRQSLEKQGITWSGLIKLGKAPMHATTILTRASIPLAELLIPFMKLSNNGIAEILVKEMGKKVSNEGSWEKGLDIVKKEMAKLGIDMENCVIKDGSGISQSNLIPAKEIANLLEVIQKEAWFPTFLRSLPIAGDDDRMAGGTLCKRMKGFSVQAKTGTIEGVSTLSGYMKTVNGKKLIVSIMINNLLNEEVGKVIEDEIVEKILKEVY